ncbi:hypothetical protein CBR_g6521 [Chara braunii]|uniref:Peptidase A2 domain-containing protein n=1 Tax=Chara braunii TaxID=69332 RepID=A0A388KKA1_CHABU|nr:hypothetical protein CBR_g6521 [Chara braunii]|eukprot:GBG70393.1 hypothetical protein CBR_g6521 [Chara braunii]
MPVAWTSGTSPSKAAEVVDPTEYLHLVGMAGTTTGMIGAIRSGNDDLEWVERESNPGPQFRTGEIDVLRTLKQLDIRVPVPVGHLLTISEAANDKLLQQCQKNHKRFTYQRIQRMLKKNKEEEIERIAPPEPGTDKPEAARVAKISLAEKDHFVRARPVLWKSAECDCEIWGKSFNALIDTGDSAVAISLDTVRRMGRLNSILPLSDKDNYVSADEEAMNIVGVIENVVIKVGRVHVLVNALVKDVHLYSVLLGLSWAMAVGARIHFDSKQLVLTQTGGKPRTVPLGISTRIVRRNSGFAGIGMIRGHDCEANPSSSPDDSSGFEELEYKKEMPNEEEWKHLVELFEHETQEKFRMVPGTTRTFHLSLEDNTTVLTETQGTFSTVIEEPILQISDLADDLEPPPQIIDRIRTRYPTTTQFQAIREEQEEEESTEDEEEEGTENEGKDSEEVLGDEEETPEEGSYSEQSEVDQSEEEEEEDQEGEEEHKEASAESEWEVPPEEATRLGTEAQDPGAARKRKKIAVGKQKRKLAREGSLRIDDDPSRDPEPPRPEDGSLSATTPSATRRRRSRSPSPTSPTRPPVRQRTNAGNQTSSPINLSPSP